MTRLFTAADTVNTWTLLNEIKGWVDELANKGVAARYCRSGLSQDGNPASGRWYSLKLSEPFESSPIKPAWAGDTFSLPAGVYRIDVQLAYDSDAGGSRGLYLLLNPGSNTHNSTQFFPGSLIRSVRVSPSSAGAVTTFSGSILRRFSNTDKLMIGTQQTSGGNLKLKSGPQDTEMMITRIGD